jgi:CDP-glucose 4,6-dehydratase
MEIMVNKDFWKNKKVLITGHTGFKGSWLCLLLNHLGANISGYSLEPPTEPSLYKLCNINSFVNSTIGDIRDFDNLLKKIESDQPEIIIHMAAQPLVRLSYSEPVMTYQTNVIGTVNLLEAVRVSKDNSVRVVVNVTTDKCYENKEWVWPYREHEPLGGYDPYSSSKACSEIVTAAYRNSFFNPKLYSTHKVAIGSARAGNVIGGGDWALDRLIPDFIRAIIEGKDIIIRSPEAIRPWQHVLEPLTGYLTLAEQLYTNAEKIAGAWNFGPNDEDAKTVKWIVEKLCKKWGNISFEINKNPQPHEATYLKLDYSKAKTLLKWQPTWNLDKTLDTIIEFTRAYNKHDNLKSICIDQIKDFINNKSSI